MKSFQVNYHTTNGTVCCEFVSAENEDLAVLQVRERDDFWHLENVYEV